jgi:hypothetical protein
MTAPSRNPKPSALFMWALLLDRPSHVRTVAKLLGTDLDIDALTRFRAGPQPGETPEDVHPQNPSSADVAFIAAMTDLAPDTLRCTWQDGCQRAAVMKGSDDRRSPGHRGPRVVTTRMICVRHLSAAAAELGAENLVALYAGSRP